MRGAEVIRLGIKGCGFAAALGILLPLSGCSRVGKVESSIVREIHRSCFGNTSCKIRARDFTPFEWDRMFAFNGATTEQDRTRALGNPEQGYQEFDRQLVFTKNGRIVYQESEPTNVEKAMKDELAFDFPDGANFRFFPQSAAFSVQVEDGPDGPYFLLRQIQ